MDDKDQQRVSLSLREYVEMTEKLDEMDARIPSVDFTDEDVAEVAYLWKTKNADIARNFLVRAGRLREQEATQSLADWMPSRYDGSRLAAALKTELREATQEVLGTPDRKAVRK